jgi:RNA polymerase sigma-70 factor
MSAEIAAALARRSHKKARADHWEVDVETFARALTASAARAFGEATPDTDEVERYVSSLHLEDLALACACADGHAAAWDHVMSTLRPILYRTADALDPTGGARDLADAVWADLYGLKHPTGQRRSLLRSFHGRSTLATWLRSVLSQRQVDRFRAGRRERPLPEEESPATLPARAESPEPERPHYVIAMQRALARTLAALTPRERLRLRCYYAQELTLAETGRITGEHEATVSRQLARSRKAIRHDVERRLAHEAGLDAAQISECFASVVADAGPLDLRELLDGSRERKKAPLDRSQEEPIP